jgi:4-alpha-glucanotransferase
LARLPDHRLGTQLASWARDAEWAHQAALFRALQIENDGRPWWQWPEMLRRCEQRALTSACDRLSRLISRELALQFLFERQWAALRRYAKERDVRILGDLPIYVWPDSVDVWAHRKNFRISADGQLDARGGCPPDEFTDEGRSGAARSTTGRQ